MKITTHTLLFCALFGIILAGCTTTVKRMEVKEVKDLSGRWNDTDSRLVSEEMIKDVLSRPWIHNFEKSKGKTPSVIVGEVNNKSEEHINVNTFIGDMERELINSGTIKFVASKSERSEIRDERRDQDMHASDSTRKSMGQEVGADFMLKGSINTINDAEGNRQIRYYQIDLTLIDVADNQKVWVGQKKIKKFVQKN
jgi:hypothetical protein